MAKKEIRIGKYGINEKSPVFMIAEIGLNHNGDLAIAKKLIDAAFACDWHCVKFQKRTPELSVPENQKNVIRDTPWGKMTYLEYRHKVEFGKKEYGYINKFCREKPILWSASAWDIPSLKFLLSYDIPFIKIPSAKLTDKKLLTAAGRSKKPVILSTGMSTIKEIDDAVLIVEKASRGNFILMHTNSTYPTSIEDLNLNVIKLLKNRYGCIVGYSGHEYGLEPTVVAVSLGAKLVERHVTMSHKMWGSDHFASLEVHAMDLLYKRLKDMSAILGDGVKKVTKGELEIRKKLRGS